MPAQALEDSSQTAADWFWETGTDFHFTYVSPSAETAFGCKASALIGQSRESIAANAGETAFWRPYREAVAARAAFRDFTYPYDHPDGRQRCFGSAASRAMPPPAPGSAIAASAWT